ncbi:MAG: transposase family protein [Deltaproteobacteria bacterium]|nr:transposase family protein [Deltaproteobacteria bacterium]
MIRLLNGAKVYLHAVMDNFSRKVLAWQLSEKIMGQTTTAVLQRALAFIESADVHLLTDSGVENVNQVVDDVTDGCTSIDWNPSRPYGSSSTSTLPSTTPSYPTTPTMAKHRMRSTPVDLPLPPHSRSTGRGPVFIGSSTTDRGPAPCAAMCRPCLKPGARKCNAIPTPCPEPLLRNVALGPVVGIAPEPENTPVISYVVVSHLEDDRRVVVDLQA